MATHFPSWPCSLRERKRDGVFLKNVSYAYISTGNTCKGRPGCHFAVEEASCQKNQFTEHKSVLLAIDEVFKRAEKIRVSITDSKELFLKILLDVENAFNNLS